MFVEITSLSELNGATRLKAQRRIAELVAPVVRQYQVQYGAHIGRLTAIFEVMRGLQVAGNARDIQSISRMVDKLTEGQI